jgi:hypothetical protein
MPNDARLALARLLISEKRYDDSRSPVRPPDQGQPGQSGSHLSGRHARPAAGRCRHRPQPAGKPAEVRFSGQEHHPLFPWPARPGAEKRRTSPSSTTARSRPATSTFRPARRAAQILMQQGKPDEPRANCCAPHAGGTPAERTQLTLAEAQLLREAGRTTKPTSCSTCPGQAAGRPELLYEAALTAERHRQAGNSRKTPQAPAQAQAGPCPRPQRPRLLAGRTQHPPRRSPQADRQGPRAGAGRPLHHGQHGLGPLSARASCPKRCRRWRLPTGSRPTRKSPPTSARCFGPWAARTTLRAS